MFNLSIPDLRFSVPLRNLDYFLWGLILTFRLVGLSCAFGIAVGIIGAYLKNSQNKILQKIVGVYVEIFRNTPLLVQLYFVYFALPTLYIDLDPNTTALLVLTLNMGAYTTEIIRGGIQSIHKSQIEAGYSLGMNYFQVFRHVILPPAMKTIAPPLSNQIILIILASCLVAQISAKDLFYQASKLDGQTYRSFEIYSVTALIYFALVEGLYILFYYINKKIFRHAPPQRLSSTL